MNREYIKYYDKFLELNGKEKEIMICIEEMSELTKELCKFKRYKKTDKESVVIKNIQEEIENIQKEINETKIKLHALDLDKENVEPKVDNLIKIEEQIVNNNEKIVNLRKLDKSMNLAKTLLEKAYEKMKNTVTPRFTENLSKNINQITNGKYSKVMVQDDTGIIVELENGNYVEGNRLSVETIDQLYLSLRLSMTEDLSTEKMPIILDEAFAYYDTQRLENILKYLANTYQDRQIILFTCTEREKDIFDKLNIKYNLINL